jgi:hypothetical protein
VTPLSAPAGKRSDIDSADLIQSVPEPRAWECASASGFFFVFILVSGPGWETLRHLFLGSHKDQIMLLVDLRAKLVDALVAVL